MGTIVDQYFENGAIPSGWSEFGNSTWSYDSGVLTLTVAGSSDPNKVQYTGAILSQQRTIQAELTFDSIDSNADSRIGISLLANNSNGQGYNLLYRGDGILIFLNDLISWGPTNVSISPQVGETWIFKATYDGTNLKGKAWKKGTSEPGWQLTWAQTPSGTYLYSGVCGDSSNHTAKAQFDNILIYTNDIAVAQYFVDGIIVNKNFASFTVDAKIQTNDTGYRLGGLELKSPQAFSREYIYTKSDYVAINGKSERDTTGRKEKFTLSYENLTKLELDDLLSVVAENEAVSFVVNHKGMLNINTQVFLFISSVNYNMIGSDYRADLQLELVEVE